MTAQTALDPELRKAYVSQCVACTINPRLQACHACVHKVGLAVRIVHLITLSLPLEKREEYWKMLPKDLWEAYANYLQH
jgi:hypothetical protein